MNTLFLTALALTTSLLTSAADAQAPHYHFVPGQTLRFLVQRDPYFGDPAGAMETVGEDAAYRPPVVERLTETVRSVAADGAATLKVTLTAEPGFEDDAHPQGLVMRTVRVSATGRVLSVSGAAARQNAGGTGPAARGIRPAAGGSHRPGRPVGGQPDTPAFHPPEAVAGP